SSAGRPFASIRGSVDESSNSNRIEVGPLIDCINVRRDGFLVGFVVPWHRGRMAAVGGENHISHSIASHQDAVAVALRGQLADDLLYRDDHHPCCGGESTVSLECGAAL